MPVIVINWRRLNWRLISVCALFGAIVFNEYLVYSLQTWRWFPLPRSQNLDDDVVVLMVGDPQIQGYRDEPPSILGTLTRWDSDRYLRNSFRTAYGYVQPDVIVFLGDLMDEGSMASEKEYEDHLARFQDIFYTSVDVQKIYIPGDNDIGGEGRDFRTEAKMQRFVKSFEEMTGVTQVKFVDFVKMDIEFHNTLTSEKRKRAVSLKSEMSAQYGIMLNHESVMTKLKSHIHPMLTELRPNLIISAHWHKSNHFVCGDCMSHKSDVDTEYWPVHRRDITNVDHLIEIDLTDKNAMNELMVPTCSYRMGEPNIGFGVLVVKKTGMAYHGVVWLPRRYTLLFIYVVVCFTLSIFPVFKGLAKRTLMR